MDAIGVLIFIIGGVLIFIIGAIAGFGVGIYSGDGFKPYFNYKIRLAEIKAEQEERMEEYIKQQRGGSK